MANRLGTTIVARTARIAAGTDHVTFSQSGFHHAVADRPELTPGAAMMRD
jgi:hypothetical protein